MRCVEVDFATQYLRKFVLHPEEGEARDMARLEFNQNIYVAFRSKVIA